MKQVRVIIRDKNTLQLEEDALKGDIIDLSTLNNIDYKTIEKVINQGNDEVYNKKLKEHENYLTLVYQKKQSEVEEKYKTDILQLSSQIEALKNERQTVIDLEISKLNVAHQKEILDLKNQIKTLENAKKLEVENEALKIQQKYENENLKLVQEINNIKQEQALKLKEQELEFKKQLEESKEIHAKVLADKNEEIKLKEDEFLKLQRQKIALNVKQTGEDLESWCHNEVKAYMQNGLLNCTWEKDNKVIKEDDENKGSKADYIFKIFANQKHLDSELLASICLEMKDENPDSKNKKKNEDYYSTLNKNRLKKECKYALLVSNLESDKANDLPIFKVSEFDDMYVVRPAYMMTFLNMITSLTSRFSEMILADQKEKLELKNSLELKAMFDSLKETYLDKPIDSLNKMILEIKTKNEGILKTSKAIDELCEKIIKNYISEIKEKLNKFEIKLEKEYKKIGIN